MKPNVTVVDYGLGNLHSVLKALAHVGAEPRLAVSGAEVDSAERLVLPGVGAFDDGMAGLRARGHADAIRRFVQSGRPLVGICLGAQLLVSESEEFGRHEGLGLIPGRVVAIPPNGVKVPHVGWRRIRPPAGRDWTGTLLAATPLDTWGYFIHSFHVLPESAADLCAVVQYGEHQVTAVVARGRVMGFQFHPEKSGPAGLDMLRAFVALKP
jgi:glutamine amidotransferase